MTDTETTKTDDTITLCSDNSSLYASKFDTVTLHLMAMEGPVINSRPDGSTHTLVMLCDGCGRIFPDRLEVSAGTYEGEVVYVRVCQDCIEAGNIDERIEHRAKELERQAERIRKLIGKLKVPTKAECEAFAEEHRHLLWT